MKRLPRFCVAVGSALLACSAMAQEPQSDIARVRAQRLLTAHAVPEDLVNRLPTAYRETARKVLTVADDQQRSSSEITDEEWTGLAFGQLAATPEGAEFLKVQLESEPSGQIRAQILLALEQYFTQHSQDQAILERHVASDSDPTAALAALEVLKHIRESGLRELLETRITATQRAGDENALRTFRDAQVANYAWYSDTRLPLFAYSPPPIFEVKPVN